MSRWNRGQAETLGVVLVIGLTLSVSGIVLFYGGQALDGQMQQSSTDSAEHAMSQFNSKINLVGMGGSTMQQAEIPQSNNANVHVCNDCGTMTLSIMDAESGDNTMETSYNLGSLVYEDGDVQVAYQGGGVWRHENDHSTMVSAPEFHYRGSTLTLPLVLIRGENSGETVTIKETGSYQEVYPNSSVENRMNPLDGGIVSVEIQSQYYQGWGSFFEQRTEGEVVYDHENNIVEVELVTPTDRPRVKEAVASTSPGELVISGGGNTDAFTDSYNSTNEPYDPNDRNKNGTVTTAGDASVSGGAEVYGSLVAGGNVDLKGSGTIIHRDVQYGGEFSQGQATVKGNVTSGGDVPSIDPVDHIIDAQLSNISEENDNNNTNAISDNNQLQFQNGKANLTGGEYYLEKIDLTGEHLELNSSDDRIAIAVEGDVELSNGATIDVPSDENPVQIYMGGQVIDVRGGSQITVVKDRSTRLWIYGPPNHDVTITGDQADVTATLYMPDTETKPGTVNIGSGAELFGSAIAGETKLKSGASIHFDQALGESDPIIANLEGVPQVTYLHVTVHEVDVE